jgi:hypothetical protein
MAARKRSRRGTSHFAAIEGEAGKGVGNGGPQDFSLPGQLHGAAGAQEQADADLVLDFLDLVADSGGRDVKLGGGLGEAQMPGGGVEGFKGL